MKNIIAVGLSVLLLAGCVSGPVAPIDKAVEASAKEATDLIQAAQKGAAPVVPVSPVTHVDELWLPYKLAHQSTLERKMISVNMEFTSIKEVADKVSELLEIPVMLADDAASAPSGAGAAGSVPGMPSPPIGMVMPPLPGAMGAAGSSGSSQRIIYDGPVSGFLDLAARKFGVSWEAQSKGISIFRYVTKTFSIVALPGDTSLQSTVSSDGGTGGSVTTAGSTFTGMSVWTAMSDAIKTMLSPSGKIAVTPATGTITVTDIPDVIARVESFVTSQNKAMARQVVVNVRVLSVDLDEADNYGINWDAVYDSGDGRLVGGLKNAVAAATGSSSLSVKVLGNNGTASSAIISALSSQGRVNSLTTASLTTINNQPVPLRVGTQTSYLASSTTTVTQGAGSTTTLQPGLITSGFSMSFIPHIFESGSLMLQFSMDMSSIANISEVSSGNSTIQTPEINSRNFLQRVMVKSGETLVLSGFEQSDLDGSSQGIGSAKNVLMGGALKARKSKAILVILIQPVVGESTWQ